MESFGEARTESFWVTTGPFGFPGVFVSCFSFWLEEDRGVSSSIEEGCSVKLFWNGWSSGRDGAKAAAAHSRMLTDVRVVLKWYKLRRADRSHGIWWPAATYVDSVAVYCKHRLLLQKTVFMDRCRFTGKYYLLDQTLMHCDFTGITLKKNWANYTLNHNVLKIFHWLQMNVVLFVFSLLLLFSSLFDAFGVSQNIVQTIIG